MLSGNKASPCKNEDFLDAISQLDYKKLEKLNVLPDQIELKDSQGRTPLLLALGPSISKAFISEIEKEAYVMLNDCEKDINQDKLEQATSKIEPEKIKKIFKLVFDRAEQTVKWLLEKGANANATDLEGISALHYALLIDHKLCTAVDSPDKTTAQRLVSELVSHGADLNAQDKDKNTVLHHEFSFLIFKNYNLSMLDLLIEKGADCTIKNAKGESIAPKELCERISDTLNDSSPHRKPEDKLYACKILSHIMDLSLKQKDKQTEKLKSQVESLGQEVKNLKIKLAEASEKNLEPNRPASPKFF